MLIGFAGRGLMGPGMVANLGAAWPEPGVDAPTPAPAADLPEPG